MKTTLLDHTRSETASDIREVMQVAYAVEKEILGVEDFYPLRRTAEAIAAAESTFFGIHVEGTLAGVIELEIDPDCVNIASLVVRPEHSRRGIATSLVSRAFGRGLIVTVSTGAANAPAIALYESLGFKIERRFRTEDGIPMVGLRGEG